MASDICGHLFRRSLVVFHLKLTVVQFKHTLQDALPGIKDVFHFKLQSLAVKCHGILINQLVKSPLA